MLVGILHKVLLLLKPEYIFEVLNSQKKPVVLLQVYTQLAL